MPENFQTRVNRSGSHGIASVVAILAGLLAIPAVAAAQAAYDVIAAFDEGNSPYGLYPSAALIQGSDGSFYGVTRFGGTSNSGTIFRLDPSGALTTLHSFKGTDGAQPDAPLLHGSDGNFYGTTVIGGAFDYGTVFRVDASGTLTTLVAFGDDVSGPKSPYGPLIQGSDGGLYGTTLYGGSASNNGTIFKVDLDGTLTVLHRFAYTDGGGPQAGLIQAVDGSLYGTTSGGGALGRGTVFRLDPSGTLTTLHAFNGSDGASPAARLIQGADGRFYGTTPGGDVSGTARLGTIFRIDMAGAFMTLHTFNTATGLFRRRG